MDTGSSLSNNDKIFFPKTTLHIQTSEQEVSFNIELATSQEELARGLMFRTIMPEKDGMLFVFAEEEEIAMWMKNTYIPLDMLFINSDRKIIKIVEHTTPESLQIIRSNNPAKYVLELNAGITKKYNIATGDFIRIE